MPQSIVTLGGMGRFLVGGPVMLGSVGSLTCDQEIERTRHLQRPKDTDASLDLSADGLASFTAKIDVLTGAKLSRELGRLRSRRKPQKQAATEVPLPWAIAHLEHRLAAGELDLLSEDGVALNTIFLAHSLILRWSGHMLLHEFARGMVYAFHHTATMLAVAEYLSDHGNSIGFTDASKVDGKSPDLYVHLSRAETVSIEVKAPPALQWPNFQATSSLERIVEKQVRRAKKQLTGNAGGLVVIGGSMSGRRLEKAVRSLIGRGRISSKLAAVTTVTFSAHGRFITNDSDVLAGDAPIEVKPFINPRFAGAPFLKA